MIEKIVSGGQTGADRAALDTAIKFDLPHGGWVPLGRLAEDGPLPPSYQVREMDSESYQDRTRQNVVDSDGTLIVSHGSLSGGSLLTRTLAEDMGKPYFHADMARREVFSAARDIHAWALGNEIRVLNVAGPRASGDPRIYRVVVDLLETLLYLDTTYESMRGAPGQAFEFGNVPMSVEQAVRRLVDGLTLKERTGISRMGKEEFLARYAFMARDIARDFGLFTGNTALLASCAAEAGKDHLAIDEAARVLLAALWETLQHSHSLRVVK